MCVCLCHRETFFFSLNSTSASQRFDSSARHIYLRIIFIPSIGVYLFLFNTRNVYDLDVSSSSSSSRKPRTKNTLPISAHVNLFLCYYKARLKPEAVSIQFQQFFFRVNFYFLAIHQESKKIHHHCLVDKM